MEASKNCISMSKEINAINKVLIHNTLYTTENEIAQSLNNYFIDSIIEITSNIEPGKKNPLRLLIAHITLNL